MPFAMETCGGIITDENLQPKVSLEHFLLTSNDVPPGYTTAGPMTTGSAGPQFVASVPSIVPVYWVHFTMAVSPAQPDTQGSSTLAETIGEVSSAALAAQWVTRITAAEQLPECLTSGGPVTLGGSVPNLTAVESGGGEQGRVAQRRHGPGL
jgi:hypothetical protein